MVFDIYQTLYYSGNKDAEYQRRGKKWFKRRKGSEDNWVPVAKENQKYLDAYFKDYGLLYNINANTKFIGVLGIALLGYFVFKGRNK